MSGLLAEARKNDGWAASSSDDEPDDDREDDESDASSDNDSSTNASQTRTETTVPDAKPTKEKKLQQLSKKERDELRKREMEELDALLEGYIAPSPPSDANGKAVPVIEGISESVSSLDTQKKKKKSKKVKGAGTKDLDASASEDAAPKTESGPVDISQLLKAKFASKKAAKKSTDPVAIAIEESKASSGKKKKGDNKHYSEVSY